MPRNRKYFPNKSVLFVTSRTEEGLPMVASLNMNFIINGILAKASSTYDVKICHYIFMANHFHMILVVDNPQHVSPFIGYIKGEIAHAINRLLGRRQKTIWQDGYDSPIILTPDDVIRYINYIYLNPVKAKLVSSIEQYPGVSSWGMYNSGHHSVSHKKLSRSSIKPLFIPALSINDQKKLVGSYSNKEKGKEYKLTIEPNAWVECFYNADVGEVNSFIHKSIRDEQSKLKKQTVIGSTALRRQSMFKDYVPKKHSRRMICLCYVKEIRKSFIEHFKSLCDEAKRVYDSWKRGDLKPQIPPGMFSPPMPVLCSAVQIEF